MFFSKFIRWTAPLGLALAATLSAGAQEPDTKLTSFSLNDAACSTGCDTGNCGGGDCCGGGGDCCGDGGCADTASCGCGSWCDLGDPFEMFGTHTCSGIKVGGWTQFGYTTYDTGMFNNHPNTVDLNQGWLYAEKVADGSCGLDWGFRMDYVYGSDGPDTQAFGGRANDWDNGWDNGNFYGHAIPQLYFELAYDKFKVKAGHFFTIVGYEVVPAPNNFFYSHSFTMVNSEPFTHTGALASYGVNDKLEVYGGWTQGWDTGFSSNGGDTFLGGFTYTVNDKITLLYAKTFGKIGFGTDATGYSHSVVADVALTDKLNYVLQSDYMDYNATNRLFANGSFVRNTLGVNQYLLYSINDCLAAGVRAEWWRTKVTPNDNADLYSITAGVNIKPHSNVILRPEVRWDRDNDGFLIPAADNSRTGFGMDMIVTF